MQWSKFFLWLMLAPLHASYKPQLEIMVRVKNPNYRVSDTYPTWAAFRTTNYLVRWVFFGYLPVPTIYQSGKASKTTIFLILLISSETLTMIPMIPLRAFCKVVARKRKINYERFSEYSNRIHSTSNIDLIKANFKWFRYLHNGHFSSFSNGWNFRSCPHFQNKKGSIGFTYL